MTKRKRRPSAAAAIKGLRDGECTTVTVKGKEKSFCKLAGKVREAEDCGCGGAK